MAQLVARLVRNEKVGGSNPPSSTTGRHPIRMSVFCMPGRVGVVPVVVVLVAPLVFRAPSGPAAVCAGGRRPAREIATREPSARSGRSRGPPWPCRHPPAPRPGYPAPSTPAAAGVSKPGQAQPPPTGTAAWPSGPSGALHTGGTWCTDGVARRLEDRPGPATAHRDRGLALPPLTGTAVWPFGPSGTLHTGGTWCAVVSTGSASTLYAVQSSPCSGCWWPKRYKVRPARTKLAKTGHFERAGRVLYRTCNEEGCAGRFLYRKRGRMARAGRILLRPPAPSSGPEPLRRH